MVSEKKENASNIDSTNIFDDFSQDEKLKSELKDVESKKSKNLYYYMGTIGNFLKATNTLLFVCLLMFIGYVYIQSNANMLHKSYLNPVCRLFIGEGEQGKDCSSSAALLNAYSEKNKVTSMKHSEAIIDMLTDVYKITNFTSSKEVLFLLEKSEYRVKPMKILEEFDALKNTFEPTDKTKINCNNIIISAEGSVSLKCSAYSSVWDRNIIIGASASTQASKKVSGTSISLASSFINFLEKNSQSFSVIDKPKTFLSSEYSGNLGYTKRTDFDIELQSKDSNISLLK